MGAALLLPDSRPTEIRTIWRGAVPYEQCFCANCGSKGPLVVSPPEERRFVFYLCQGCADTHGKIDGIYLVPDTVYEQNMQHEMLAQYGKPLAKHELAEVLNDPHSTLAKLAKERPY